MVIQSCHLALRLANGTVFRLINPIQCSSLHSFSSIYAISNYLTKEEPKIFPPLSQHVKMEIFKHITSNYNPFFQSWNGYIKLCILRGMALRNQSNFYIEIPIEETEKV